MSYIENPKTKGSGIMTCIPQSGICPINCDDCFFQSGRSYLEPLNENLPNFPIPNIYQVVRVNDGNDSNNNMMGVIESTKIYKYKFYNTSIPINLEKFDAPVVLTINPGKKTDTEWTKLEKIPKKLMFVRIRTNTWNVKNIVDPAIEYYTENGVPVVLTFMAYYNKPKNFTTDYIYRKRTINSYWAITTYAWKYIMNKYNDNILVYSCGKIEGEKGNTSCARCGNCIREYYVTMQKLIDI